MKGELLTVEKVLHRGDGGGCMAAWRSSKDGKERPRNGNRYRFRARQIGLNNVAQTHSTSQSHTYRREGDTSAVELVLWCCAWTKEKLPTASYYLITLVLTKSHNRSFFIFFISASNIWVSANLM